jgi:hypothetical protein
MAIVGSIVVLSTIIAVVKQVQSPVHSKSVAQRAAAAKSARVLLTRIASLDIHMNLSQAQAKMPIAFPEASTDEHRKDYSFDIEDPMIGRTRISWDWGCDCLQQVNLHLKDYPTQLAVPKILIPCLEQKLGAADARSSPPFHYYWTKLDSQVDLSYAPGMLSLGLTKGKSRQQGFAHLIEVIGACDALANQP